MTTDHQITKRAADGSLTVSELWQFLKEFDKAVDGASTSPDGTAPIPDFYGLRVKARVSFTGGIRSITVTIPGGDGKR